MQPRRTLGDIATLGVQQDGDRLQRGGLAVAIGAQQCHDPSPWHLKRHSLEHQDDVIVNDFNIIDREDALFLRSGRRARALNGGHEHLLRMGNLSPCPGRGFS